jgi:hypothetical protein
MVKDQLVDGDMEDYLAYSVKIINTIQQQLELILTKF